MLRVAPDELADHRAFGPGVGPAGARRGERDVVADDGAQRVAVRAMRDRDHAPVAVARGQFDAVGRGRDGLRRGGNRREHCRKNCERAKRFHFFLSSGS